MKKTPKALKPKPASGSYLTAVSENQFQPAMSRVLSSTDLRHQSSYCHSGLCPERHDSDRHISGVDMFATCETCGVRKADWLTTHHLYRPWSKTCGPCAEAHADPA